MVILGVGVLAIVEAQSYFLKVNEFSSASAQAGYLAGEVRERMRGLTRHDPVTGLYIDGTNVLRGWGPETGETTLADFDDVDDFDGVAFGAGAPNQGPIDSRGWVIPNVEVDGSVTLQAGNPVPLRGWRQEVSVEKVEPTNYSTVRADDYQRTGVAPRLRVDEFALRVTVVVTYQGPLDTGRREMARMSWVVP